MKILKNKNNDINNKKYAVMWANTVNIGEIYKPLQQ